LALAFFPLPNSSVAFSLIQAIVMASAISVAGYVCFADGVPRRCRRAGAGVCVGAWLVLASMLIAKLPVPASWWAIELVAYFVGVALIVRATFVFAGELAGDGRASVSNAWRFAGVAVGLNLSMVVCGAVVAAVNGNAGQTLQLSGTGWMVLGCGLVLLAPIALYRAARLTAARLREKGDARCAKCGYPLTGIPSGICPECGAAAQRGDLPPLRVSLAGVPWTGAAFQVAGIFVLASLVTAQRPDGRCIGRIPARWLMLYADRLLPAGQRNSQDWTFDSRAMPRSFTNDAMLAQDELLRRLKAKELRPLDQAALIDHMVRSLLDRQAQSDKREEILATAATNGLLSREQSRAIFDEWLEAKLVVRSEASSGEPLGLKVVVSERWSSRCFLGDPRLMDAVAQIGVVEAVSVSIDGSPVAEHVPFQFARASYGAVNFAEFYSKTPGLVRVPNGLALGEHRLAARVAFQMPDSFLASFNLSRAQLDAAGVPATIFMNVETPLRVVADRPVRTVAVPDAARIINERLGFFASFTSISVLEKPGQIADSPAAFAFRVFIHESDRDIPVGVLAFDHHLQQVTPYLAVPDDLLSALCDQPDSARRLILHAAPNEIRNTNADEPVYDGPDIEVPVRCMGNR
jgi:hypothetical protein